MAIPDFQTVMRPILDILSDGKEHSTREIIERIAVRYEVTDDERAEQLKSLRLGVTTKKVEEVDVQTEWFSEM